MFYLQTGSLGKILDLRNAKTCPSFKNLSKKSAVELKGLCTKAIEEQIRQLVQAEGQNTKLERKLRKQLQEVAAIDPEKANRKAERYL
jgi:hypothetical protein